MKNSLQIAGGLVGAVIGFVATLLLLELVGFGNRADPIASGILALLVFAPAGAIAGLVLGTGLAMRVRGGGNAGPLARNSLKAFGTLIVLCAAAGTTYYVYAVTTATPWLNPNAPNPFSSSRSACRRERRRRPPRRTSPSNCRPTSTRCPAKQLDRFRRDGDRSVIAGQVDLAFRTAYRQVELKSRTNPTGSTASA